MIMAIESNPKSKNQIVIEVVRILEDLLKFSKKHELLELNEKYEMQNVLDKLGLTKTIIMFLCN